MSTITSNHAVASSKPKSEYNPSPISLGFPDVPIRGTSSASKTSNFIPPSLPKAPSPMKKKRSSVFSFFTVKEPSTQAWLDYQENLRKQQPTRQGRVSAVGLPMVSSAKLPPTVPKVNSRWDGVPDSVIQREKEKKAKRRSGHSHAKHLSNTLSGGRSMSRSSSQSSRSGRRTQASTLSFGPPPLFSSSATSTRNDLPWTPSSADARDFYTIYGKSMNSGPETPLSESGSFIPKLPESIKSSEELHKSHFSGFTDLPEPPKLSASPTSTPGEASPSTPQFDPSVMTSPRRDLDSSIKVQPSQIQTTVLTLPPRQEQVILHSMGPNILGPPMSFTRKLKAVAFPADETQELQMPGSQPSSILRRETTLRKTPVIARPSISDYFSGYKQNSPGSDVHLNRPHDALKSFPAAVSNSEERDDPERSLTPTPQADKAATRKSKLSFFKS
ncbi:hypothetical protein MMC32_005570 [Xylographa parallela]|nr:hypothetical protein [Xylographa parallela]